MRQSVAQVKNSQYDKKSDNASKDSDRCLGVFKKEI
jgi:hypothetical protein